MFQINASSTEDGLNFYDSGHRFEHSQLLLVLLRSLPYASKALQSRALQVCCVQKVSTSAALRILVEAPVLCACMYVFIEGIFLLGL